MQEGGAAAAMLPSTMPPAPDVTALVNQESTPALQPELPEPMTNDVTVPAALLQELLAKVQDLTAEVRQVRSGQASYVQAEAASGGQMSAEAILQSIMGSSGGDHMLPSGINGALLPKNLVEAFHPPFAIGQKVRVRRDAIRFGTMDEFGEGGTPWGPLLDKLRCPGVGTIRKLHYLDRNLNWKYHVQVAGLTTGDGMGFRAYELEAI